MPPEVAGDGVIVEENPIASAGNGSSKSRGFLSNKLSIFQSKRFTTGTTHRRGASLDATPSTCTSHWQYKFRDALFCERPLDSTQCKQPSVRHHHKEEISKAPRFASTRSSHQCDDDAKVVDQSRRNLVSRWLRIVGRFGGKRSKVREDHHDVVVDAPVIPRKVGAAARKYNWVSCEDLARVSAQKEMSNHHQHSERHDEIMKPVLEPVQFATTELRKYSSSHCSEEVITHVGAARMKSGISQLGEIGSDESLRVVQDCKMVVAHLRCKKGKEQGVVAVEARLLAKDYPSARATLATLGAIAPLVSMLDSSSRFCTHTSLRALYTLAIGNDVNKAAVVDAGAVPKMLALLCAQTMLDQSSIQEAVLANLLSLSALDRNKVLIGASGAVSHLVQALRLGGEQVQGQSLRALYNLSLAQSNIKVFVDADATPVVMANLRTPTCAEKALAIVGNMVAIPVGRKSVTEVAEAMEILVTVLGWGAQFAKCQERAAYILMVIAHHSYGHRQAMTQKGAIPALLEVSLMGSALAQKRAVRVLECLREDRNQGRPMSAPLGPPPRNSIPMIPKDSLKKQNLTVEGSKILVTHMVQQSLEQNLQRIVRRANLPAAMDHTKRASSLSGCTSSKSLPF